MRKSSINYLKNSLVMTMAIAIPMLLANSVKALQVQVSPAKAAIRRYLNSNRDAR